MPCYNKCPGHGVPEFSVWFGLGKARSLRRNNKVTEEQLCAARPGNVHSNRGNGECICVHMYALCMDMHDIHSLKWDMIYLTTLLHFKTIFSTTLSVSFLKFRALNKMVLWATRGYPFIWFVFFFLHTIYSTTFFSFLQLLPDPLYLLTI